MKRHSYIALVLVATILGAGSALAAEANLFVKEWYPKANDFVFVCDATDFEATSYSWHYGDGHKLLNIANGDTYHRYTSLGTFTVTCEAMNGETIASDSITVPVTEIKHFNGGGGGSDDGDDQTGDQAGDDQEPPAETSLSVAIAPFYPQDSNYVFQCDAQGFAPNSYSINFGDGQLLNEVQQNSFFHTYDAAGIYTVSCSGSDGATSESGSIQVTVSDSTPPADNNGNQTNQTNQTGNTVSAELAVVSGFPFEHNYAFECTAGGFTPTSYTFVFSDGATETRPVNDIYHTFSASGEYAVSCTATDGASIAQDSIQVSVQTPAADPDPASGEAGANVALFVSSQEGMHYELTCEDYGAEAQGADWHWNRIVNGTAFIFSPQDENNDPMIFGVTFSEPGQYQVTCQPGLGMPDAFQVPRYYNYADENEYHNRVICSKGCSLDLARLDIVVE